MTKQQSLDVMHTWKKNTEAIEKYERDTKIVKTTKELFKKNTVKRMDTLNSVDPRPFTATDKIVLNINLKTKPRLSHQV